LTGSGSPGSLLKTLESSDPVGSMIEIVRHHAWRVKHWQHGQMALRRIAAGMLADGEGSCALYGHRSSLVSPAAGRGVVRATSAT
jgi:hypothetical protein